MKKFVTLLIITCFLMVACGIKPGAVDPPEGDENKPFPRTYPDVQTDPPPVAFPRIP